MRTFRMIAQPLIVAIALAMIARATFRIYSVPSASMAPTLQPGDQIAVTLQKADSLERGDVVVFRIPNGEGLAVKRVIGLPGDLIDSRLGRVRVGGYTLAEPYVLAPMTSGAIDAQLVPAGGYFVMGDNRGDSVDSRSWGLVPHDHVVGRARMVLWSSSDITFRTASGATATKAASHGERPGIRIFHWID